MQAMFRVAPEGTDKRHVARNTESTGLSQDHCQCTMPYLACVLWMISFHRQSI